MGKPRFLSIKEAWESYEEATCKAATPMESARRRVAFEAGAMMTYNAMDYAVRSVEDPEEAAAILNRLRGEVNEFVMAAEKRLEARRKTN